MNEPKSLQEAIIYFSNPDNCVAYITARRWRNGVTCPGCGSDKVKFNPKRRTWQCSTHHAKREFSVKVGTVMEDSHIPLNKWVLAYHLMAASKKGMSAHQLHRMLGVSYKSAWFLAHRIRESMTPRREDRSAAKTRLSKPTKR